MRRDVDVSKKVLVHEVVIALRVIHGQADIFIEIERRYAREVELLLLVQPHELLIQPEGGGARRHAEDGTRLGVEQFRDDLLRDFAHLRVVSLNNDFHRPARFLPTCAAARWAAGYCSTADNSLPDCS